MARSLTTLKQHGFGRTMRRDRWWIQPLMTFLVLTGFIVYATWAAFQPNYYWYGPYLSPFFSPDVYGKGPHSWFGPQPPWWPEWLPFTPALLILPIPAGFRLTCYYYRGAYYKAFWADPPACGVGEPRKGYTGEKGWPLLAQNIHRFFLYVALIFLVFLWKDTLNAMFWPTEDGGTQFGIGVGTIVLLVNVCFLTLYTTSCHSLRHIVGGFRNRLSNRPVARTCYRCVSCLNTRHMVFAWISLLTVMFADLYVRLVAMGIWTDYRIL